MDLRALIDTAKARGVTFKVSGNRIKAECQVEPDNDTKALLETLRGHTDELRRVLTAPATEVDAIIDDKVVAVLIDSAVLGAEIWFALRDDFKPDPGDLTPVFYASELPFLRTKTPEQLRSIFNIKTAFGGGMVRQ